MSIVRDRDQLTKSSKVLYSVIPQEHMQNILTQEEIHKVIKTLEHTSYNLKYYDTCTQEDYVRKGRFWEHIDNFTNGGFNKDTDRVMVCGGPRHEL